MAQKTRKTLNIEEDLHFAAQDAAWSDGRITVGRWAAEALEYYLRLSESNRHAFREYLANGGEEDRSTGFRGLPVEAIPGS